MNPLISVVIPSYNSAKFLPTAVSSVVDQTYKNFEIIIVDDCSNDDTERVVKTFSLSNRNIKYIKHDENKGLSSARNTGIMAAKGDFIAFLDADDIWSPRKLEYQYRKFEDNPKLGVVFTGYTLIDLNKRIRREYCPPRFNNQYDFARNLLVRNIVTGSASSVMTKKECFEKVGLFDTALKAAEDWDMWMRIAHNFTFGAVESPCVTYVEHSQNMSRNIERMITYSIRVIHKNLQLYEDLFPKRDLTLIKKRALSIIYLRAAQAIRDDPNERKQLLIYLGKSIACYPFKAFEKDDKYIIIIKSMLPNRMRCQLHRIKELILTLVYGKGHSKLKADHEKF